jgi:hypothetical protein
MEDAWLKTRTKSVIVDRHMVVNAVRDCHEEVAVDLHVVAIELNYGPVIYFNVRSSIPMKDSEMWDNHPFQWSKDYIDEEDGTVGNIIDDTPAVRAMIEELVSTEQRKFYSGTDAGHKGRLIKAIAMFWS